MPAIFREDPPKEMLIGVVQAFGLRDLQDTSLFAANQVRLSQFEQILLDLVPYYVPCKAEDLIDSPLTPPKALRVLRQLSRVHGVEIRNVEKTVQGRKSVWHQLVSPPELLGLSGPVSIAFD